MLFLLRFVDVANANTRPQQVSASCRNCVAAGAFRHWRRRGTGAERRLLTENANLNRFMFNNAAGSYFLAATGSMTALQTEGNWHAAVGVINGASSYIAVDAAVTTGTVTINPSAASPNITGSASTTCDEVEAVIWDNFAVSQSQATTLTAAQKTYWGF